MGVARATARSIPGGPMVVTVTRRGERRGPGPEITPAGVAGPIARPPAMLPPKLLGGGMLGGFGGGMALLARWATAIS